MNPAAPRARGEAHDPAAPRARGEAHDPAASVHKRLYAGTSGFAYPEWKPGFYPPGLPRRRFLEHYSHALGACEVNATFYRLQSTDTLAQWAAQTARGFRFAVKAHRRITHARAAAADADFVAAFVRSVRALGDRLGPVLFQLPPYRSRDDAIVQSLTEAAGGLAVAFEFRHDSWAGPEVTSLVAAAGATVCVSDTAGPAPAELPPGPLAYVRLRKDRYTERERAAWAALLEREAGRRDVFAFAKHEGIPAGDPYGGVGLAQWLARRAARLP